MKYLAVILLTILAACNNDVELGEASIEPVIVVDGRIEHGKYAEVFLTKGFPVLAKYDSLFIFNTFLNYAKVELFDDAGNTEILTLFKDKDYFPPYVYRTINIKGKCGSKYRLKVSVDGKIIYAETSIPDLPYVSFSTEKVDSLHIKIIAHIDDPPFEQNFYYYRTKRLGDDKIFVPSLESTFSDFSFNGEQFQKTLQMGLKENLVNVFNDDDAPHVEQDEYLLTDTVWVRFSTITSQSYELLNSTFLHLQSRDNPFTIATNKIKSNVDGGVGHFIGLGTVQGAIYLNSPTLIQASASKE